MIFCRFFAIPRKMFRILPPACVEKSVRMADEKYRERGEICPETAGKVAEQRKRYTQNGGKSPLKGRKEASGRRTKSVRGSQRKRYARTAGKGRRNSGQTVSEPRENNRKSKRFSQSVTVNGRNTYRTR